MNTKRFDKLIVISGRISSGKTTLSKLIADRLECPFISISSFLKLELSKRKIEINRENLQIFGEDIYKEFGEAYIIENTLSLINRSNKVCILDGIRYPEGIKILKRRFAAVCITIYLDLDSRTRFSRNTENYNQEEWIKIDNSFTELAIDQIKQSADIILHNNAESKLIVDKILSFLSLSSFLNASENILSPIANKFKILCIGQLTEDHYMSIDRIPPNNQFANVKDEIITYGGNATNSAYCFTTLGCQVYLSSQTSKNFPSNLISQLKSDGIETKFLSKSLLDHPRCFMYFTNKKSVNFYSFSDQYKDFQIDLNTELFDLIFVSGNRELTISAFRNISKQLKRPLICWSPGYETRFLEEADVKEFIKYTDILIVSENEYKYLEHFYCFDPSSTNPKVIIETQGVKGSRLKIEHFEFQIPALSIDIKNSYGAGDYFAAGFAFKYLMTGDEIESIFFATKLTFLPLSSFTSKHQ